MSELLPPMSSSIATVDPHNSPSPMAFYLASLGSEHSRRAMQQQLIKLALLMQPIDTADADERLAHAHRFPWHQLAYHHTIALRSRLQESSDAVRSINLALSAVRGVIQTCRRMGLMDADSCQRALDGLKSVKGTAYTEATGRALGADEIAALLRVCVADETEIGARDAAIIAAMYSVGLRRSEVVGLTMDDVFEIESDVFRLTIKGKGSKVRTAYLAGPAGDVLADYLAYRGREPGPLFKRHIHATQRTSEKTGRMTPQAILYILHERAVQAGVAQFSPHDLRRTYISAALDAGVDIATLAGIVGHSSVETTRRYDRRGERAKLVAAGKVPMSYTRRTKPPGNESSG